MLYFVWHVNLFLYIFSDSKKKKRKYLCETEKRFCLFVKRKKICDCDLHFFQFPKNIYIPNKPIYVNQSDCFKLVQSRQPKSSSTVPKSHCSRIIIICRYRLVRKREKRKTWIEETLTKEMVKKVSRMNHVFCIHSFIHSIFLCWLCCLCSFFFFETFEMHTLYLFIFPGLVFIHNHFELYLIIIFLSFASQGIHKHTHRE